LNILLLGRFGAGKSHTGNLIHHVLKKDRPADAPLVREFFECGQTHTTPCTTKLLLRKKQNFEAVVKHTNVPLTLVDLEGIEPTNNFNDDLFLEALLEGRVPSDYKGTTHNTKIQSCIDPARRVNLIIVLAKSNLDMVPDKADKLREMLVTIGRNKNIPTLLAVTHLDTIATEKWEETLLSISALTGVPYSQTFPLPDWPSATHPQFETEVQVLQILTSGLYHASTRIQNEPQGEELKECATTTTVPKPKLKDEV